MSALETQKPLIVTFPLKIENWDEPMSDAQLVYQTRLFLTKKLNMAADGRHQMTDKDKNDIQVFNDICLGNGFTPIHYHSNEL